jgi:Cd2+/Zn2+-exporting ATPase
MAVAETMEGEIRIPGKKILYLHGLCCPDCARKIEEAAGGIAGVKHASLDFAMQRLTIEAWDQHNLPEIAKLASEIALSVEPELEISYVDSIKQRPAKNMPPERSKRLDRFCFFAGLVLFLAAWTLQLPPRLALALYLVSYLLIGGEVVWRALQNIARGRVFDENFLMSIATIGAFAIGEYPEGVAVMLFYQIGEMFQRLAVNRSRKSISALLSIRPDFANLKAGEEIRKVSPEAVGIDDWIIVKPGEKIPLDGRVVEGSSSLDTSALTGEALPRDVEAGSEVLSGSVNQSGLLTIEVTREYGESTVAKILDLVQNASSKKAPTENFITKFARYYTPLVVFAALGLALIPPLVIPGASFAGWLNRALVFLVVSCPCALVISIPLSFFGGIGGASRNGILIKGSNYLEALNHVETVVFDKTGTLTRGVFTVTQVVGAQGWRQEDLLSFAAHAEAYSNHPIAVSIQKAYNKPIDPGEISEYEEIPGLGIRVRVSGKTVLAGSRKLMETSAISFPQPNVSGTIVYLAVDGTYAGYIVIADEVKPDSKTTVQKLKAMGIKNIAMLTGDSRDAGEKIARELGLDRVYADLLPQQKVDRLEILAKEKKPTGKLVFVGDGINDAPVLARSDIGIAMGGLGSDAAIEAADVVLMTDEPAKLITAIRIARKTRGIVWQNIIFALSVKGIILILGAVGIATMWEAVFGDVGVAIIAILNAMRVIKTEKLVET